MTLDSTDFAVEVRSQWRSILRRFFRHRLAVVSLLTLLTIFMLSLFGNFVWRFGFTERDPQNLSQSPTSLHPFGTDSLGKDMLALTLRGAQRSILIALVVSFLSTTIGVVLGSVAGYFRGWVDAIIMRITDLLLTIPLLILAGCIAWQFDGGGSWWLLALLLGSLSWQGTARVVRGEFLALREREFVEAARAIGVSDTRLIFRHMLPNAMGPIIVGATLSIAGAILVETALSYLGLGVKAPDSSLGLLVSDYQAAFQTRPWLFWFPGMFIVIICLSVNFIGDGLRDAFDPKQSRVRK